MAYESEERMFIKEVAQSYFRSTKKISGSEAEDCIWISSAEVFYLTAFLEKPLGKKLDTTVLATIQQRLS